MKIALAVLAAALVLAGPAAAAPENPCSGPQAARLLCPNLRIGPPSEMYVSTLRGQDAPARDLRRAQPRPRPDGGARPARRAEVDEGQPADLQGRRRPHHRPHERSLHFTDVGEYFGGSYWKVHQLARFELRKVLPGGGLGPVLRTSPKLNYCLRDLERTRPGRHSPDHPPLPRLQPGPEIRRDRLGTSVGWSDIYPADYDKQYIDVSGLRGCFVF